MSLSLPRALLVIKLRAWWTVSCSQIHLTPVFINKVILEHKHTHSLAIAYGCFSAESQNWVVGIDHKALKAWNIYSLAFYRKCLHILILLTTFSLSPKMLIPKFNHPPNFPTSMPHIHLKINLSVICWVVSNSVTQWTESARLLCLWNFPGKNIGVGYHFLLQRIFPTQWSNLNLPYTFCIGRWILYH